MHASLKSLQVSARREDSSADAAAAVLVQLTALKSLDFSSRRLTLAGVQQLTALQGLTHLSVTKAFAPRRGSRGLAACSQFSHKTLHDTQVGLPCGLPEGAWCCQHRHSATICTVWLVASVQQTGRTELSLAAPCQWQHQAEVLCKLPAGRSTELSWQAVQRPCGISHLVKSHWWIRPATCGKCCSS